MTYWYINEKLIIKSNSNKESVKDNINDKFYDTYSLAVSALSAL